MLVAQLLYLANEDPTKDITLYINSPGGSVSAGMAIYDTMQYVPCDVSTVCFGMAASMGAFLLGAGTCHVSRADETIDEFQSRTQHKDCRCQGQEACSSELSNHGTFSLTVRVSCLAYLPLVSLLLVGIHVLYGTRYFHVFEQATEPFSLAYRFINHWEELRDKLRILKFRLRKFCSFEKY